MSDRCDRCSARALRVARKVDVTEPLQFCAHHAREHERALTASGWSIRDIKEVQPVTP